MDEDVTRILNCVNCCWPEIPFTHNDIRRPTGEKFRELLRQFLKSFIVGNYQLPNVSWTCCHCQSITHFLFAAVCRFWCICTVATQKCIPTWKETFRCSKKSTRSFSRSMPTPWSMETSSDQVSLIHFSIVHPQCAAITISLCCCHLCSPRDCQGCLGLPRQLLGLFRSWGEHTGEHREWNHPDEAADDAEREAPQRRTKTFGQVQNGECKTNFFLFFFLLRRHLIAICICRAPRRRRFKRRNCARCWWIGRRSAWRSRPGWSDWRRKWTKSANGWRGSSWRSNRVA